MLCKHQLSVLNEGWLKTLLTVCTIEFSTVTYTHTVDITYQANSFHNENWVSQYQIHHYH